MKKITIPKIMSLAGLAATGCTTTFLTSCNKNNLEEIHIISINDFHGAVAGIGDDAYAASIKNPGVHRMMREIAPIIEEHPGSILVSAGDNNSGDTFSSATKGETLYPMLKAMDVRYSAVGNHAFEWGVTDGMGNLKFDKLARTENTEGNYFIAANILNLNQWSLKDWVYDPTDPRFLNDYTAWQQNLVNWASPWKLVDLNGHYVCLIGLTTQKTLTDGNTDVTSQLSFIDYKAAVAYSKYNLYDTIGDTWYNKIESFVLLTHIDSGENAFKEPEGEAIELASTSPVDFDAIISAHSHKVGAWEIYNRYLDKKIWVGQAGTAGRYFLDTKLTFNNSKRLGQRLESVSMTPKQVYIEYDGHNPSSKDAEEVKLAKAAATREYEKLLATQQTNKTCQNVWSEFLKQKDTVNQKLDIDLCDVSMSLDYNAADHNVGHAYYMDDKWINEPLGAFVNMATIEGFTHWSSTEEQKKYEYPMPAISFYNQDSLTTSYKAETTPQRLKLKAMYDMQPHDNSTYVGYLSIAQIWNILNYLLAGGNGRFSYESNRYYDKNEITKDRIYGGSCCDPDKKLDSKYLCGPLSFYGLRFEIEQDDDTMWEKEGRRYRVKSHEATVSGKTVQLPNLLIYDPSVQASSLYDPSTWKTPEEWIANHEGFVPCIINSFVYDGGNDQCRMFKCFFEYNVARSWGSCKTYHISQLSRDWVQQACELHGCQPTTYVDHDLAQSFGEQSAENKKLLIYGARY